MAKHFGKCALCGRECELTFEHIPPRSAFNNNPAKQYTGDKLISDDSRMPWDFQGLQYISLQKGAGLFSLCDNCNNLTGTWYGDTYRDMAQIITAASEKWKDEPVSGIGIKDTYAARFIKQVLSMFCSVNSQESIEAYRYPRQATDNYPHSPIVQTLADAQMALYYATDLMDELRAFVLDKDAVGLDKSKFKVCMYLTRSSLFKMNVLSAVMNFEANSYVTLSEITARPFGFILYFNPPTNLQHKGIDITAMADLKYDDKATVEFPLRIFEMNTYFPDDYRSKEEIEEWVKIAKE